MNVASLLEKRRNEWSELETLCDAMEVRGRTKGSGKSEHQGGRGVARFSTLYRSACADLALAEAYQLPPSTTTYLHRLVARAHNQLYRSNRFTPLAWVDIVFRQAPQQIFKDLCVRIATIVFFGFFVVSMYMGKNEALFPGFAEAMVGQEQLSSIQDMYEKPIQGSLDHYVVAASFYIEHNTGIGLQCFAFGILIVPTLVVLAYNAVTLGTLFGYMARPDIEGSDHFFEFVTAHGPFELTAIALSAAAGLRLGIGFFFTGGLARITSLRRSAVQAVPVISAAAVLFFLAAFTEGFISPSPLPYLFKAGWSIMSAGILSFYFVLLGFPRQTRLPLPPTSPFD